MSARHLVVVTTLVDVRAHNPGALRDAISELRTTLPQFHVVATHWSMMARQGSKARLVVERSFHLATCSYCGKRAKGLRAARDAANTKHWFHAKCLAEVSR